MINLKYSSFHRKLGLDLVPRVGPLAVSPTEIGIVALHNVHMTSDETAKNTSVSHQSSSLHLRSLIHVFIVSESRNLTPQSAKKDSHASSLSVHARLRLSHRRRRRDLLLLVRRASITPASNHRTISCQNIQRWLLDLHRHAAQQLHRLHGSG